MTDKFTNTREATQAVAEAKYSAGMSAARAVRMMEEALILALDGERLAGLPNLATSSAPYRGVRCLSKSTDARIPKSLDNGQGREVLCINSAGRLVFARMSAALEVSERVLDDSEIKAEWAEDIAECILLTVDYHLEGCASSAKRYAMLQSLSNRLIKALNGEGL